MPLSRSSSEWDSLKPALLIALALATLQIFSGIAAYYQSKNLLWDSKYQTAQNLTKGLIVSVVDQIVTKDYGSIESRILQTMSNAEVASVVLTDTTGKVISALQRDIGQKPHLAFDSDWIQTPELGQTSLQSRDDAYITTWAPVKLGMHLGWIRLQTFNFLDSAELASLRKENFLLSGLSIVSGLLVLGIFLWRAYFSVIKREHIVEAKLDETTKRLMQSEKLASLGEMAAGVAHEINNPVGYVSSNLATLQKYLGFYEEVLDAPAGDAEGLAAIKKRVNYAFIRSDVRNLVNESQEGIERVKTIIKDLKDFARTNTASNYLPSDIHVGLKSTLNIAHNQIKNRAQLKLEFGNLPLVECVPSQINQVFLNLLVNAAQAVPVDKEGLITIRTYSDGSFISIEVEDNGEGMPDEILHKIFDPFFTTKEAGKGTGLGLSVSQKIIQDHAGTLTASSSVGVGSVFKITLPVRRAL
ncbi:MAG: GHKL domain-containing protein [Burkholderiales bacterium]|nr:GHKL domain-containing protein [Burkholderiales bacterium]